jgi:hypothetical protein
MSNELSAQELLPPEKGLTLLGSKNPSKVGSSVPRTAIDRSALRAERSRPLATVVTGGNCKIFRFKASGWRCDCD